jgi:hypothetical protein
MGKSRHQRRPSVIGIVRRSTGHPDQQLNTDASDNHNECFGSLRVALRIVLAGLLWELPLGMLLAPRGFLAK